MKKANSRITAKTVRTIYIVILTLLDLNNVPKSGDTRMQIIMNGIAGTILPMERVIMKNAKKTAHNNQPIIVLASFMESLRKDYLLSYFNNGNDILGRFDDRESIKKLYKSIRSAIRKYPFLSEFTFLKILYFNIIEKIIPVYQRISICFI